MTRTARVALLAAAYVAAIAVTAIAVLDRAVEASTSIPVADGFEFPVGDPRTGAGPRDIRAFCSNGGSRGYHLGDDLGVVDQPVRAAAAGRVVVARFDGEWDGDVLVEHRLESGATVFTQYGHLQSITVEPGQDVARGEQVGVSGPPPEHLAVYKHLHFEVKRLATTGAGWSAETPCPPNGYLDPLAFVRSSRPAG